jgi:hypothetical protein
MNRTVDANVASETHVFHNGWYGYKNWGIGLACYATYPTNPRAPEILAERGVRQLAGLPAGSRRYRSKAGGRGPVLTRGPVNSTGFSECGTSTT